MIIDVLNARIRPWLGMLAAVMVSAFHPAWAGTDRPALQVAACAKPPIVDGVLTDACWQTPPIITNLTGFKAPDRHQPVRAWLARDAAWLYVAVDVPHPMPAEIKPRCMRHNGNVCADDSIELFLDPGAGGALYFHFMLNAINVGAEKMVAKQVPGESVRGIPWRSGTRLTPTGWTAELAIPLSFLAGYGNLNECRINLCLNQVLPVIDPSNVRVREEKNLFSWAPVSISFHEPDRFGDARGLLPPVMTAPFFAQARAWTVGRYAVAQGRYAYTLNGTLLNYFNRAGKLRVRVVDCPQGSSPNTNDVDIEIGPASEQAVAVAVPVDSLMARSARVYILDAATGEEFQSVWLIADDMRSLDLMNAWMDRSYYTDETNAYAIVTLSLPESELAKLRLVAQDAGGARLGEIPALGLTNKLGVKLQGLPPGTHTLKVDLCQASNRVIASRSVVLTKRPPQPGLEWKTDRFRRLLLKDGKPFFPIGIVMSFSPANEEKLEEHVRELAADGFNTLYLLTYRMTPDLTRRLLNLCERYQLYYIDGLDNYTGFQFKPAEDVKPDSKLPEPERVRQFMAAYSNKLAVVAEAVRRLKSSPRLLGYTNVDEPGEKMPFKPQWARALDLYNLAHTEDGYHPVFALYSSVIPEGDEWTAFADVLGTDPYWVPAGPIHRGTPNYVSQITCQTDQRAAAEHKPNFIMPMSGIWSASHKRCLLPDEQICQTYLALIHGAKGIIYYNDHFMHQLIYDTFTNVTAQLRELGPMVVDDAVPQTVVYNPGVVDPERHMFPDVQAAVFRKSAAERLLLAANGKPYPVAVSIAVDGLRDDQRVKRLFSDQTYPVSQSRFEDRLEPFAVRAYYYPAPAAGIEQPAAIRLTLKADPSQARTEAPAYPRTGRPDKKNLAANPSFEEATYPGWPDYYIFYGLTRRIGQPDATVALVTNQPYHGKYCLQMASVKPGPRSYPSIRFYLAPQPTQPCDYVLSAYLRADRDGVQVGIGQVWNIWKSKIVTLTKDWKRYSISGMLSPGLDEYTTWYLWVPSEGVVWMDAIQMEKGVEPTTFEP